MATGDVIDRFIPGRESSGSLAGLLFGAAVNHDEKMAGTLDGYAGGGLTINVVFSTAAAVAGNVVFRAAFQKTGDEATDLGMLNFAPFQNSGATMVPAEVGLFGLATMTFGDGPDIDDLQDGDLFILKFGREAKNGLDSAVGNAIIHVVHIKES